MSQTPRRTVVHERLEQWRQLREQIDRAVEKVVHGLRHAAASVRHADGPPRKPR